VTHVRSHLFIDVINVKLHLLGQTHDNRTAQVAQHVPYVKKPTSIFPDMEMDNINVTNSEKKPRRMWKYKRRNYVLCYTCATSI